MKQYELKGVVLGNAWGGGKCMYKSERYYGTNIAKLKKR